MHRNGGSPVASGPSIRRGVTATTQRVQERRGLPGPPFYGVEASVTKIRQFDHFLSRELQSN
jgi:hypothetical protein